MIKISTMTMLALLGMAIGCGGGGAGTTSTDTSATTTTGGAGGSGGGSTSSSTTGAGGTMGTGGGAPAEVVIGLEACPGKSSVIGPIVGETSLPDGTPVNEDGGVAPERLIPPSYPWTITAWSYSAVKGTGPCKAVDHSAIYFIGPATGPLPATWPSAVEVAVVAADLAWDGNAAVVTIPLASPVVLHDGEAFIAAPKYAATKAARSCLLACDGGGADPNAFYSLVNAMGTVDPCPAMGCGTQLLSLSPTPADAHAFHNDDRIWLISATGHAGE